MKFVDNDGAFDLFAMPRTSSRVNITLMLTFSMATHALTHQSLKPNLKRVAELAGIDMGTAVMVVAMRGY